MKKQELSLKEIEDFLKTPQGIEWAEPFKILFEKKRKHHSCLFCGKNLYSLYPKYKVFEQKEPYNTGVVKGCICSDCFSKFALNHKQETEETK
jgi:hypothetical protein